MLNVRDSLSIENGSGGRDLRTNFNSKISVDLLWMRENNVPYVMVGLSDSNRKFIFTAYLTMGGFLSISITFTLLTAP